VRGREGRAAERAARGEGAQALQRALGTTKVTRSDAAAEMRELDADGNSTLELDEFLEAASSRVLDSGLPSADLERLLEGVLSSAMVEASRIAEEWRASSEVDRGGDAATEGGSAAGDALVRPTLYRPPGAAAATDDLDEEDEDDRSQTSSGALSIPVTHVSRGSSANKQRS
jgi:hypothetical protein